MEKYVRRFSSIGIHLNRKLSATFSSSFSKSRRVFMSAPYSSPRVHVLISGAGIVGMSLACAIRSNPLTSRAIKLTVIDPAPIPDPDPILATYKDGPQVDKGPFSLRTTTLNISSIQFLKKIGALEYIPPKALANFDTMRVWDESGMGSSRIDFSASEISANILGAVVENDLVLAALVKRYQNLTEYHPQSSDNQHKPFYRSSINFINGNPPPSADNVTRQIDAQLADGSSLLASLLVIAEGARSPTRSMLGFKWVSSSYAQRALVANVRLESPTKTAWQRFLATGPIALLPVLSHENSTGSLYGNIIWSTTEVEAKMLQSASDQILLQEINKAFASEASVNHPLPPKAVEIIQPRSFITLDPNGPSRASFPLNIGHAPQYIKNQAVLLGDAAHVVHPLAGQGVNLGLDDAKTLSNIIAQSVATGRFILDYNALLQYQGIQMPKNLTMMGGIHSIKTLFETNALPLAAMRLFGLRFVQNLDLLKSYLMKRAMGL